MATVKGLSLNARACALPSGQAQKRSGNTPKASPSGETSYVITNLGQCRGPILPDGSWMERGVAAYEGLNRTDPQAIWSFQGCVSFSILTHVVVACTWATLNWWNRHVTRWAIIDWDSYQQGSSFRGFVDAVPEGR